MSVSESTRKRFQVDWLISNLRWLLLISVGLVSLIDVTTQSGGAVDPDPLTPFTIIWAVAIIYNLVITLVLVAGAASPALPAATVAIDTALTIGFVATSGGLNSSLLFFALFPVLTANLRYPWWFSSLLALIIVVGCGLAGYRLDAAAVLTDGLRFGASALILLLAALVSGLVGDRLKVAVLQARRLEAEAELRQLRASHERARVVFELASTLSATLNSNAVLETILEVGEAGMQDLDRPGTSHVSAVMLSIREGLHIVAARHLSERDQRIVFSGTRGVLAQALAGAEPVLDNDPGADPELGQLGAMRSCREAIVVPLCAGFESFGAVVFGSTQAGVYTEDHIDLLMAICSQAIVALQNAQLYQSLMQEKEHIVSVEEDARKKLARDLHDGPTQDIASIAMRVNTIRMLFDRDPSRVPDELVQVEQMARRTTTKIRHMLFTLRPLILESQGLYAALEQYISKLAELDSVAIHLEALRGVDQAISRRAQSVVFYIIEEAVSNARRHANPSTIWVRLRLEGDVFVAEVEDDGAGFDFQAVRTHYDERGSLGVVTMHERTDLVDGKLVIDTAPGNGTLVRLSVPVRRL